MKDIMKALLTLFVFSSAFFVGFYIGEEKIKSKISNFQEDIEKGP